MIGRIYGGDFHTAHSREKKTEKLILHSADSSGSGNGGDDGQIGRWNSFPL